MFNITKHKPVIPTKPSNVADVGGIVGHNSRWHLACRLIDVIAGARADICLELKAMVPQRLGWSSLDHFAWGSPFELTDAAFSGLLPWGRGFSHSRVAVCLLEFVSKLPFGLFYGVVGDHGWGHTMALEDKGQGLMRLPFALHRVSTCQTKGSGLSLSLSVALSDPANIVLLNMACNTCLYQSIWSLVRKDCKRMGIRHVLPPLCIVIMTVRFAHSREIIQRAAKVWGSIDMVLCKQMCPLRLVSTLKIWTFEVKTW
jgi:hypothetical protein